MSKSASPFGIVPTRAVFDEQMTPAVLRVLMALATYADEDRMCHPAQATVARRLHITRQAVGKSVDQLVKLGYLERVRRFRPDGGKAANEYRIVLDQPPHATPRFIPMQPHVATPMQPDGLHPHATSEVASKNRPLRTDQSLSKVRSPIDGPSSRGRAPTRVKDNLPDVQNSADWQAFYAWRETVEGKKYLAAAYATRLGEPMQFANYRAWVQNHRPPQQQQEEGEAPCPPISSAPSGSAGARTATASASASTPSSHGPASSARTAANVSRPA